MIFLEFNGWVVEEGHVPASLCWTNNLPKNRTLMALADRVFEIKGNQIYYLKNRFGIVYEQISDEDKVALTLRAVLI